METSIIGNSLIWILLKYHYTESSENKHLIPLHALSAEILEDICITSTLEKASI